MMKISKPILMNDFMLSHIQFTSLNLVNFKNIKLVYNGNEKIHLEFEHPSKMEVSPRDWIGIFPRGWANLQQYVTFEWISQSIISPNSGRSKEDGEFIKRAITFCPKYHINCVNQSALYQFLYVGKQIEVLGVSSYFRFDLTCLNDSSSEIECLVPVTGKVRSTSVSDLGTLSMTNELSSTSLDSRKLIHTSSIHSLQNLDIDGKLAWSRMNFTDDKKNLCLMKRAALPSATGDSLDPYSSYSEPIFPMSLPLTQCKKCYQFKKGGEFLRSQQALQSKLKIVMERNKILEERAQEMKKGLERVQSESKRMKMLYYNVNKEKIAYEKFVKDFIKSLEKDSIVRVMYGNTEILVKKVNYVGMEEHPRDKKTSKRERELKAVIGLQEITIRNLINSLQEKAKSVEELNQTVKLAQVFSAARTDNRELGIDGEESADESSNSDNASEYEFSLAKPSPPEEVSEDPADVLDNIRRKSEIELKNIGITRSLGKDSESDLDVTNLSVMTYECDKDVPKKPRLVDNMEDCWPFPRNPPKKFKQSLSADNINLMEPTDISKGGSVRNAVIENNMKPDESVKDGESDVDTTTCEDYYDACEALSVRSFSPEPESGEDASYETNGACRDEEEIKEGEGVEEKQETKPDEICEENAVKCIAPEKLNKFTCELSIDFVHGRSQSDRGSENVICTKEQSRSERSLIAFCPSEPGEAKLYTFERERSLITFKISNKNLEIKITKVDQKEDPTRSTNHQNMMVQFPGSKIETPPEENVSPPTMENPESSGEDNGCAVDSIPGETKLEGEEYSSADKSEEKKEEARELDIFSPRTEWNDANDVLESDLEKCDTPADEEEEEEEEEAKGETSTETRAVTDKTVAQWDEKFEIEQHFLKGKCNTQMLTEDSMNNLKTHQDSLRYEKNLQFLNNKCEGKDKESDDETLKEKPSAILIQSGQSKVAVIRYQ